MSTTPDDTRGFVEHASDFGWLDDNDGHALDAWRKACHEDKFFPWPNHVPAPLDGYEWQSYGPLLWSRPACSRWHRLIFRLPRPVAFFLFRITSSRTT